jgi:hypothetical protein
VRAAQWHLLLGAQPAAAKRWAPVCCAPRVQMLWGPCTSTFGFAVASISSSWGWLLASAAEVTDSRMLQQQAATQGAGIPCPGAASQMHDLACPQGMKGFFAVLLAVSPGGVQR